MRRFIIVGSLFVLILCARNSAFAGEEVRINNSGDSGLLSKYSISISAQSSNGGDFGHSFVAFNKEDDQHRMSSFQVVGFYPPDGKTDSKTAVIKSVFVQALADSPGKMKNDLAHDADITLIVSVNADQYNKALSVFERWSRPTNYYLSFQDCTTFAGEVARAIGLSTPNRAFSLFPESYLRDTIRALQEQKGRDAAAKEHSRAAAQAAEQKRLEEAEAAGAQQRGRLQVEMQKRAADDMEKRQMERQDFIARTSRENAAANERMRQDAEARTHQLQQLQQSTQQLQQRMSRIGVGPGIIGTVIPSQGGVSAGPSTGGLH